VNYNIKIQEIKLICKMLLQAIEEHERREQECSYYQNHNTYGRYHEKGKIKSVGKVLSSLLIELRRSK